MDENNILLNLIEYIIPGNVGTLNADINSQGELIMPKRKFTRVDFSECVSVNHEDQVFFGDIKNVSLQGLFIKTDQPVPLRAVVDITVYQFCNSSFRLHANVIRCEKNGIGFQIQKIDVNSFACLRDVVAMHCNDLDLIMRETYQMIGCIH